MQEIDWCFKTGCDQNRYSSQCILTCSARCKQHCDVFNGSCKYGCNNPNALPPDCIGKNFDMFNE